MTAPSLSRDVLTKDEALEVRRVCAMFGGEVVSVLAHREQFRERKVEAGIGKRIPNTARILEGFPYDACDVRGMLREFRRRLEEAP